MRFLSIDDIRDERFEICNVCKFDTVIFRVQKMIKETDTGSALK